MKRNEMAKWYVKRPIPVQAIQWTGGLGFIGFNALQLWKNIDPSLSLTVIDAETYAAQFMLGEKLRLCKENDKR